MLVCQKVIPKKSGVYKIVDQEDNIFYVGSTGNLRKRFTTHVRSLINKIHYNSNLQRIHDIPEKQLFF